MLRNAEPASGLIVLNTESARTVFLTAAGQHGFGLRLKLLDALRRGSVKTGVGLDGELILVQLVHFTARLRGPNVHKGQLSANHLIEQNIFYVCRKLKLKK